jgi:hypothetical protein
VVSLRVTRDKRGYEHVYVVADARRRGRADSRLLYWVRMPGGLRVGRDPFDPDTREALQRANPDVEFDWPALTRSLAQSLAAARWAARQERPGAAAPSKNARRVATRSGDSRGGRPGGGGRDRDRSRDGNAGRQGPPRGPSADPEPPAEAEPDGE